MQKSMVFVFGLLLGAAIVLLVHARPSRGSGPIYVSRLADASNYLQNHSLVLFGDMRSISCVVEDGKTVCYVLSQ